MPNDGRQPDGNGDNTPPSRPDGNFNPDDENRPEPDSNGNIIPSNSENKNNTEQEATTNKDIQVEGISNQYNGVADYVVNGGDDTTSNKILPNTGIGVIMIFIIAVILVAGIYSFIRNNSIIK